MTDHYRGGGQFQLVRDSNDFESNARIMVREDDQ